MFNKKGKFSIPAAGTSLAIPGQHRARHPDSTRRPVRAGGRTAAPAQANTHCLGRTILKGEEP